jgi:hypothetical protein
MIGYCTLTTQRGTTISFGKNGDDESEGLYTCYCRSGVLPIGADFYGPTHEIVSEAAFKFDELYGSEDVPVSR